MASIICGNCSETHPSVEAVRACHNGAHIGLCHWLVERWIDHGPEDPADLVAVECGAVAIFTQRGWSCAAGHEHVTAEARYEEGWDYAEDAGEALALVGAGVQPFTMDGHIATSPADFFPKA